MQSQIEDAPKSTLAPADPLPVEAVPVGEAARMAGFGRSTLYIAMDPDPSKRGRLPFLASLKLGKARRIRVPTLRAWLEELERANVERPA